MDEFEVIARYFTRPSPRAVLGVGDDCALLQPRAGMQLAISSDMLVSGRHFFSDVDPRALGHKALAVNLSDLAACGAAPLAFSLALALPAVEPHWLSAFSDGLFALAQTHDCALIGGDTTQGPLTICISIYGEVPPGQALLRDGARAGDDIYVSANLGDAALALHALQGRLPACAATLSAAQLAQARQRLEWPTPRVALGLALRGIASAAADISDGLLGDLGHILKRSQVGASVDVDAVLDLLLATPAALAPHARAPLLPYVLAGGDDYELVFTAPAAQRAAVQAAALASATPVSRIGCVQAEPGLRLRNRHGDPIANTFTSYQHF